MKQLKILLPLLAVLGLLVGCKSAYAPQDTSSPFLQPESTALFPAAGGEASLEILQETPNYRILRANRSYRNSEGQVLIRHSYDYIALIGDSAAASKINAALVSAMERSMYSEELLREHLFDATPESPYRYVFTSQITEFTAQRICVVVAWEWWMGGVHNEGYHGYVFSTETGDAILLSGLSEEAPEVFEQQLKQIVWEQIQPQNPWDNAREVLEEYTLDTFDYAIHEGQLVLYFPEYAFFPGAYGPVTIFTGIYV